MYSVRRFRESIGGIKMDIEKVKKNIEYWENEVQKALKEDNINKAIGCRILANRLIKK